MYKVTADIKEGKRVVLNNQELSTDINLDLTLYEVEIVANISGLTEGCYSELGEMQ